MKQGKLQENGYETLLTCQPSTRSVGRLLREMLIGSLEGSPEVIAQLFAADRLDHLQQEVLPHISCGKVVLCDRYVMSSLAYQGEYLPFSELVSLNRRAMDLLPVTGTIYLDLPPDLAMKRITARGNALELYETQEKLAKTYEKYQLAFQEYGDSQQLIPVDASLSQEDLACEIWEKVAPLLEKKPLM